jgi:hypothetical protein
MAGWMSTVPGIINALVRILAAAPELEGVVVRDGPAIESTAALEVLSVGWTGVEGETDIEAQLVGEGMGGNPDREVSSIRCVAAVLAGNTDVAATRARAYELMTGAAVAIARDRTLQRTVMRAMIGSHSLSQDQTDRGLQAVVIFSVDCDAYTLR